jgi:hypothetical protein
VIDFLKRTSLLALLLGVAGALPACGADDGAVTGDEDDLTSLTARQRKLTFEGFVFVDADASSSEILRTVHAQTQSAFGALREANISVAKRELADVDPAGFIKEPVTVIDAESGTASEALRVRYRYEDQAVVPKSMSRRTAIHLGLLHGDFESKTHRILEECTGNTEHDIEFEDSIWYVFNPSLESCQEAMDAEQSAIDAARDGLDDAKTEIVPAEFDRLYIPMTARLSATKTSQGKTYPEYDRLYAGGVEKGKLVISLVNGEIDHAEPGTTPSPIDDEGYTEMMGEMDVILSARPSLKIVKTEPSTDLTTFTVNGKTAKASSFKDFVNWEIYRTGYPQGFSTTTDRTALRKAVASRLLRKWIRFEEAVTVKVGAAAAKAVTIQINQYYGSGSDETPHRRAIRTSDVFLYNGHSYIGSGPLDPERYDEDDFPASYQIFFVDACVSYNYYNQDYFALKDRGTLDLDTITNGLESFSDGSGAGLGRFVVRLLDGKQASYKDLLTAAQTEGADYDWGKDALRVVDGEVDNVYKPTTTPITVTAK